MNIRIISPAGSIKPKLVDAGAATLKAWGHKVTIGAHAKGSYGRFSGTPEERAEDIIEALNDPDVEMLWATRGGYGCMQILDMIPLSLIAEKKKPLVGYSDITALHALWLKAGVQTLHAPMMKHLGEEPGHRTSQTLRELLEYYMKKEQSWPARHNLLFMKKAKLYVAPGQGWMDAPADDCEMPTTEAAIEKLTAQSPDGIIRWVGGNMAVLSGLHGTPLDFDYAGKVLFIEDIAESPYKIDRMLQQLKLMGVFGQIRPDGSVDHSHGILGLVCGQFTGCDEDPTMPVKLWDNFRQTVTPYDIPLWMGAPIGHVVDNYPVIEG